MRTIEPKTKALKKPTSLAHTYPSWDAYVQAKVSRANKRLSRMDLSKLFGEQKSQ